MVYLAIIIVSCVFWVGTYLESIHQINVLQQQGFVYWRNSSPWVDLSWNILFVSPGSSVWYAYHPGQSFSMAFPFSPILRSSFSAATAFFAGVFGYTFVHGWDKIKDQQKLPAVFFVLVLTGTSISIAFPANYHEFSIDLRQRTIAVNSDGRITSLPLSSVVNFETYWHHVRHSDGYSVYANYASDQQFELVKLNDGNQANAITQLAEDFLNSEGITQ